MDSLANIYGDIPDKSELVLGAGNHNNIYRLLTYFPTGNVRMINIPEIIQSSVVELILTYEKLTRVDDTDRVYFSLAVKEKQLDIHNKYINVKVELDGDNTVAYACVSNEKAFFWIDSSSIDNIPRSQLLSGTLYSLKTVFGEKDYVVFWKLREFPNNDKIAFLPTTWYESTTVSNFCQVKTGIHTLVESLTKNGFKGYTSQHWCEEAPHVVHCNEDEHCGKCLGKCYNQHDICNVNEDPDGENFICGDSSVVTSINRSSIVFVGQDAPTTTGTTATWIAIVGVFIIVALLTFGISRKY